MQIFSYEDNLPGVSEPILLEKKKEKISICSQLINSAQTVVKVKSLCFKLSLICKAPVTTTADDILISFFL